MCPQCWAANYPAGDGGPGKFTLVHIHGDLHTTWKHKTLADGNMFLKGEFVHSRRKVLQLVERKCTKS